jgi:hypothetical protein
MSWPASTTALSRAVHDANDTALTVRNAAVSLRGDSAAGDVNASRVLSMWTRLNDAIARLTAIAAIPGIGAWAKEEMNDPALDVATEFNAMMGTMADARDWIAANFPKDASGYLLEKQFSGTEIVSRTFTPAQTAGLRTELDALIATIG